VRKFIIPEYLLDTDEQIVISSKNCKGIFFFHLMFFLFLTTVWAGLMYFYIFDNDLQALYLSRLILPFPLLTLGLILFETEKQIFITNKNVIIKTRTGLKKIKLQDIKSLEGFFPPRGGVECLRIIAADKKCIVFVNVNGLEIEQKFKELCPTYKELENDWDKQSILLAVIILIMVFLPLIITVYSIVF